MVMGLSGKSMKALSVAAVADTPPAASTRLVVFCASNPMFWPAWAKHGFVPPDGELAGESKGVPNEALRRRTRSCRRCVGD